MEEQHSAQREEGPRNKAGPGVETGENDKRGEEEGQDRMDLPGGGDWDETPKKTLRGPGGT